MSSNKTEYIKTLPLIRNLVVRESEFLGNIIKVYSIVEDMLAVRVPVIYPNFTLHDIKHCERVLENLSKLINDVDKLNDLELTLLIYSSLLHDIGMAVSDEIIQKIKKNDYNLTDIKFEILLQRYHGNEVFALQEILRRIHADISYEMVNSFFYKYFSFLEIDTITFTEEVAILCKSHTKDFIWLNTNLKTENEKSRYKYNLKYLSILLRIGDILDIDGRRTPQILYHLINPHGQSNAEWRQHFIITNLDKIKEDEKTKQKKIVFYGSCSDVEIHRKLLRYIEWIEKEIDFAVNITSNMVDKYKIYLKEKVENNIESIGYTISNYKLEVDFLAITNLLMGEKIYGKRILGIRELLQNSLDACLLREEIENVKKQVGDDFFKPLIKIILNKTQNTIVIKDNGTGMSEEIVRNFFLNVGKSFYQSDDYILKGYDYKPVGNFGVGFLACFMLSDTVKVVTKYYNSNKKIIIEMEKNSEYISFLISEDPTFSGTEIILSYNQVIEQFEKEKISIFDFVKQNFITDEVKIEIIDRNNNKIETPTNSIFINLSKTKNEAYIDISPYFADAKGFIHLNKKKLFIKDINDLFPKYNSFYLFDVEGLKAIDDIEIEEIINDNNLKYLDLILFDYSRRDEFETALKLIEDVDEVVRKFDEDSRAIILFRKKDYDQIPKSNFVEDEFYFELEFDLEELLGAQGYFCPIVYVMSQNILKDDYEKLYMKFQKDERIWSFQRKDELYLRNVKIDFNRAQNFISDIITISGTKINFYSKDIIPVVSRNSLTAEDEQKISYTIFKLAHLVALENFEFNPEEKRLLQKFINTYYSSSNNLLRN